MRHFRCSLAALLVALAAFVAAPTASAEPAAAPRQGTRINDIDGDGKLDVVFVDSGEWANPDDDQPGRAGSVQVLFGDGKVQQVTTTQLHDRLFEDSHFGSALVVGDLNRDGYADIVVSDQFALDYRGRVWAMWGSAAGISASRTTVLATGGQGVGASLAFVPLPEPVLAIAATVSDKAHVDLYRVRNDGRLGERHRISIGSPGIVGRNFTETDFGSSMSASGDLLVIGAFGQAVSVLDDRVAIGVPSEQLGVHETAGAIQLLRVERTGHGLRIHPGRLLTQASAGVPGDIGDIHVLGEEVLVTKLCAQGYGAISADYRDERLLSVPFIAGTCSSGWLSAEHKPGPPAVSILRRFVDGVAVDEPVIVVDDYTLQIGRPGSLTQTDLKGKVPAPVRLLAPPAA